MLNFYYKYLAAAQPLADVVYGPEVSECSGVFGGLTGKDRLAPLKQLSKSGEAATPGLRLPYVFGVLNQVQDLVCPPVVRTQRGPAEI